LFFNKKKANERAFDDLIARWAGFVRQTLRQLDSRMPNADLEELEQDVRLKLWQALQADQNFDKPASYIRRLVMNVAIDAARRRSARGSEIPHTSLSEPGAIDLLGADQGAHDQMENRAHLAQIAASLMQSQPESAKALSLHLQGFTTDEIALLLAWTEAKARNVIYRLIERQRASDH
jgi:RNA polymerase sigma factor (sigma-70 family)